MERGRYVWLYLQQYDLIKPGHTVFHFGPERALVNRMKEILGEGYFPLDLVPHIYNTDDVKTHKFDICSDLPHEPDESVDLIIANHILEHLPCSVERVICDFARVLKPQGSLILTVPMLRMPKTIEDMTNISNEERTRRFGQSDHWRVFGNEEFPAMIRTVLAQDTVVRQLEHFRREQLEEAAIPLADTDRVDSNTIFHYRKRDRTSVALSGLSGR